MRYLVLLLIAYVGLVSCAGRTGAASGSNGSDKQTNNREPKKLVCFFHSWNAGRRGIARFSPLNINPYLCTHLIYANGEVDNEHGIRPMNPHLDIDQNGLTLFTNLRRYNKKLKILMGVGGQFAKSARFSAMVTNDKMRKAFPRHAIEFARQYNFDGINLNWQFPTLFEKSRPTDKENYLLLTKEMRAEIELEASQTGKPKLLLTMNVPGIVDYIDKGYDIMKLTPLLDWMHLLTYDFHTAYETYVSHHTPLYASPDYPDHILDTRLTVNYTINYLLRIGAENRKLILGLPAYGRTYTLFDPDYKELGGPADGPGDQAEFTIEKGIVSFFEICDKVKKSKGWTIEQANKEAMGPYAYRGNQWISYDDIDMIKLKTKYAMDYNLGGVLFMSMDMDDFRGTCFNRSYPLIEAARETLLSYEFYASESSKTKGKPTNNADAAIRLHNLMTTPEPPVTPDPEEDPALTKARITRLVQEALHANNISDENTLNMIANKINSSPLGKPNRLNDHTTEDPYRLPHAEDSSTGSSLSLPIPEFIKVEDIPNTFQQAPRPTDPAHGSIEKHPTAGTHQSENRVVYMIYPPSHPYVQGPPSNSLNGQSKFPAGDLQSDSLSQKPMKTHGPVTIQQTSGQSNKGNDDKVKIRILYHGEDQEISISIK